MFSKNKFLWYFAYFRFVLIIWADISNAPQVLEDAFIFMFESDFIFSY